MNSDTGVIAEDNAIIDAFNHHFISAGYLFERTSKPIHNDTGMNADRGNLLNDQRKNKFLFTMIAYQEAKGLLHGTGAGIKM